MPPQTMLATVENRALKFSNLEKVLWPDTGFTKGQMIDYYTNIAPFILPHLHNRALTRKRYPDGIDKPFFFEKNCPSYKPAWLKTVSIPSRSESGKVNYCIINDLPSLLWTANLAAIEFHVQLSLTTNLGQPTVMVFDLDPGTPATIRDTAAVALQLKDMLEHIHLQSFVKTSGGKGLHLYVPLNTPATFPQTKELAKLVATQLESAYPDRITSNMNKELRTGKVFIDWSQNDPHKTTCCVYSLRARTHPAVSTPITWDEVEFATHKKNPHRLEFDAPTTLKRAESQGDLFAPILTLKQKLPK